MPVHLQMAVAAALPVFVLAAGCSVTKLEEDGRTTRVSISTPVGDLDARTGENTGNTGLPVYPGAQRVVDRDSSEPERANVTIATRWFGLRVVAAEYESRDAAAPIAAFYRDGLRSYGAVTECRGDLDFNAGRPECRAKPESTDTQLIAGTENDYRMVTVSPRAGYTSFALVSIKMGS